jgi:type II secretory pathway component PulF
MPSFAYEALDPRGQRIQGVDDAVDQDAVLSRLLSKGLQPIKIRRIRPAQAIFSRQGPRFSHEDVLFFTRELGDLLEAGVPLERALAIIADSSEKPRTKELVTSIKEDVQGGKGLSGALAVYPEIFNKLYVNMVTVGEMGGVLPQVLKRLGGFLERSRQIKRFIITSSIYPGVLMLVGILSVVILITFVVPKFGQIFDDLNQPMPTMTKIIFDASVVIKKWWWGLFSMILIAFLGFRYYRRTPEGRAWWDKSVLRLPLAGAMISKIELGRFCRTLGTLIESGVPILKGISLAGDVVSNSLLKGEIEDIYKGVRQGKSLSQLMKKSPLFPTLMVNLVGIGEETGALGAMLLKVADDFDEKIQHDTKVYLSLVEPVTIVLMGIVIGGIILSMLLAIFGINDVTF